MANKQYEMKYQYLIPCNMYGVGDKYDVDRSHFVAALIKKIYHAKVFGENSITLFGDGTPIRQFMDAYDLAKVIALCLENDITESFNVCPDEVYSIKQIAHIALEACDAQHLEIKFDRSKPNGQFRKDADNSKFKDIFPKFVFTSLLDGIRHTHRAFCEEMENVNN